MNLHKLKLRLYYLKKYFLSETRSSLTSEWKAPSSCLFKNILRTQSDVFYGFEADDDVA